MDEDLFTIGEDELWANKKQSEKELMSQEFTIGEDDLLQDAEDGLFDTEESLW
jgi:hypothetical protein